MFGWFDREEKALAGSGAGAGTHSVFENGVLPVWSGRNYQAFAREAYMQNVIAYRSIQMIAGNAASVPWALFVGKDRVERHAVLDLLHNPNNANSGKELFEAIYSYSLIAGNSYVRYVPADGKRDHQLRALNPKDINLITRSGNKVRGYKYIEGDAEYFFATHPITGQSDILHLKHFHPLDNFYGLSPIEAAAYSIDQHNEAAKWNQALLQNSARPSGALVVKQDDANLTTAQLQQLREDIKENFSNCHNSGRPLLLEGGMEWREMGLSPRDMDYIEGKNSAARDIALAFGVPPQLLGLPGDNTYSNFAEARLSLWEQTILPMMDNMVVHLNRWLVPRFGGNLRLSYDVNEISALAPRREKIWKRVQESDFMTENEKRAAVGLGEK